MKTLEQKEEEEEEEGAKADGSELTLAAANTIM